MGMKIVKLNSRYKQFKEHGHVIAMRFDVHSVETMAYERACREKLTGHGYTRADPWYSYFGSKPSKGLYTRRPYWITFRNEMDLTLVLLSVDLTN
jgi:hypothetical protein